MYTTEFTYHTHTHTHSFNGYFLGKLGLAGCPPLDFLSPFIARLCRLLGQTQTLYILLDTVPTESSWMTPLYYCINLHLHTVFDPICISLAFKMSKPS